MLTTEIVSEASYRIAGFASDWRDEFPLAIHGQGLDRGGYRAWSGEFSSWLTRSENRRYDEDMPDTRLRLVRAMRMLRKVAPREHDVLWRVFGGETVYQVQAWLNDRAIRLGHPERFSIKDTVVIIVSGVDKLAFWH